jgi:hypothetical protein
MQPEDVPVAVVREALALPQRLFPGSGAERPGLSFTALATALLYFDLTAHTREAGVPEPFRTVSGRDVPPTGHPFDPTSWSDEDRPRGWYVDPEEPSRMRYWGADGAGEWSTRTAKTPRATLAEWRQGQ